VPLGGFGSKLNAMHQWHEARGIRAIHSTGRRDEYNRDYIRWCFADPAAAKEFAEAFADMIALWPPAGKQRFGTLQNLLVESRPDDTFKIPIKVYAAPHCRGIGVFAGSGQSPDAAHDP
jgi:uncharacterized protein CbrC (UPF0167 family)